MRVLDGLSFCIFPSFSLPVILQGYHGRQVFSSYIPVMLCRMMLCPVVCIIELTWSPVKSKLFLILSVFELVESHVHRFSAFLLDFLVDHTFCHCIISLHRRWRLLVSHNLKNYSQQSKFSIFLQNNRLFCYDLANRY